VKALSKKDKLLASAQKNLLKGQVGKAVKEYEEIVKSDPGDVRNRQKLGELYSRLGMTAEALDTYELVARHYSDNGFYLKAIAVFKQMQKVDPTQSKFYYRLGELNEKQGLLGNALAEYRLLLKLLQKEGETEKGINVLEKMIDLDPNNLRLRLELVEMFARLNKKDRAAEVFGQMLEFLRQKKVLVNPVPLKQALESFCPGNADLKVGLAGVVLSGGDSAIGIGLLKEVLTGQPEHREARLLLADGYHLSGEFKKEQDICRQFLRDDPADLDVREKFVRASLACGKGQVAFDELDAWKEAFIKDQRVTVLKSFYEQLKELLPDNKAVSQTLRAVYEQTGEGGKLFDLMSSGEKQEGIGASDDDALIMEMGEAGEHGLLRGRPAASLPDTGKTAESSPAVKNAAQSTSAAKKTVEPMASSPPAKASAAPDKARRADPVPAPVADVGPVDDDDFELEIELEVQEPEVSAKALESNHLEFDTLDLDKSGESSLDVGDLLDEIDKLDMGSEEKAAPLDIAGELEEVEFYFQQGLRDEAKKKCRALLKAAPDCEEAWLAMERITGNSQQAPAKQDGRVGAPREKEGPIGVKDREKSRLDGSLSEFKKGLEDQIGSEDTETHFNLGIAYKEMGLFDDAVEQFDKAMHDPLRRIDCLTLKGICLIEKGAFERAVTVFKTGLALVDLKAEERTSLYYELGLLYQSWGRSLEALDSFQCVADVEPFFREVETKIRALRKELGLDDNGGSENSGNGSGKNRVSYI
jgi:tetratricopeptide (TPR) repeat protein